MEHCEDKPPKNAMEFYVKLFCKKKSSKDPCDIRKALKSWLSFSAAEQQPFLDKFKKCQQDYEKRYAVYLKSVEPFMKKKRSRKTYIEDTRSSETEHAGCGSQFQTSRNILQNTDGIASHEQFICDQIDAASDIDSTGQQEKDNQIIQRLSEPTPPSLMNGKHLFEAVSTIEDNTLEWKNLSQIERGKYNSAVLSIKRDYIRKYQNYLESLSAEELFQHYIKSHEN